MRFLYRSNACKNTPEDGFVELAVEMVTETPHACTMRFAVRDSGCGVKPEEQPRIFAPYTQVGVKQGTGMGLSLSQALVKQMGGTVHVVSPWRKDGPGAEFSFVVTLPKAAPVGPVATTRAPPLPDAWKVLVADDNAVLRLCVVKMLKKINDRWTVDEAVSGEDVVKLASSNEYDVLILDENMAPSGLKGTEATRRLRASGVTGIILGLTGSACEEHNAMAKNAGQNHVFGKPFSDTKALATLLRVLSGKIEANDGGGDDSGGSDGGGTGADAGEGQLEENGGGDGDETSATASYPKHDPTDPRQPWTDEDTRPSELPCVDEAFQRRVYADPALLRELVAMFTKQLNSTCAAAETSVTPEHRRRLHRLVHDLKGIAGTLGYISIQRAAYDLAEATRGSGDGDVAVLVARLVAERARFRSHYQLA